MIGRFITAARSGFVLYSSLTIISLTPLCVQRSDAGSTFHQGGWTEVATPTINGFKISFADSLHGWIIGQSGTIIYTSDAGATWQSRQCPVQIVDADLVSPRAGWVRPSVPMGGDSILYRTTDTGLSWTMIGLPRPMFFPAQAVSFVTDSVVYAALDSAFLFSLWATTNAGATWSQRSPLTGIRGANIGFFNTNVGYVGNFVLGQSVPVILRRTIDGGFNWTQVVGGLQPDVVGAFGSFRFFNGKLGSYHGEISHEVGPPGIYLAMTWNRGESWTSIYNFPPILKTGMARDSTHRWLLRYSGSIRRTTNGGATWQDDTLAVPITDILYDLHGHQFALGAGRLFRYDSTLTDVVEPDIDPNVFALHQNYPNPFNPTTNIGFQISDFGLASLKVFDVLGREVATLVNEMKQPGEYKTTWDAGNAANGVYYYRLHTGPFVSTRKMLLIR